MNAPALNITPALPAEPFDLACRQANEWRGRCQNALARAEAAVTQSLLVIAALPDRGKGLVIQPMVGPRYDALAKAIGPGGPFAADFGKAAATLAEMRRFDRLRVAICHGVGEVTLDRQGRWLLVLRTLTYRSDPGCPETFVIRENAAKTLFTELARTSQILTSQLGNVLAHLSPGLTGA